MKQKLSLSGVNLLISLLFCDPSKPIYRIDAVYNNEKVCVFSNSINLPDGCEDVSIKLQDTNSIRSCLLQLRDNFECDSFSMFNKFLDAFKSAISEKKENEKDEIKA